MASKPKEPKQTATEKIMSGYGNKRKKATVGDRETPPARQAAATRKKRGEKK